MYTYNLWRFDPAKRTVGLAVTVKARNTPDAYLKGYARLKVRDADEQRLYIARPAGDPPPALLANPGYHGEA